MKKRILVVEDDAAVARVLSDNLSFSGFEVEWVANGTAAIGRVRAFSPDLILLDVMLPGQDGFDLCGLIRQGGRTPVIMLTARDQKDDKLRGLAMGADDYVTKPFDFDELQARVRAVLRRSRLEFDILRLGQVTIDLQHFRALKQGSDIHLTRREFDLLAYLAERHGHTVSRNELLREIWVYPEEPHTRAVDSAIKRLRNKIEFDPHNPEYIHTVHGDGYCLTLYDTDG